MADVFQGRLTDSYKNLKEGASATRWMCPTTASSSASTPTRRPWIASSRATSRSSRTPPAFRWVHFTYAIEKNLNVFMEKPVTVDGPTSKRMLKLAEDATAKNLKVGVGLMSRHSRALQELAKRVQDGEIGDVILQRGYRMHGPIGFFASLPKPKDANELLYQVQRFHSFIWASGGNYSDFYIHIIDHLGWMKGSWPVKAQALGGRHYRQSPEGVTYVDQNLDTYAVEYTYADGSKFNLRRALHRRLQGLLRELPPRQQGLRDRLQERRLRDALQHSQEPEPGRSNMVWESKVSPDQQRSVSERVERPGGRHPRQQALQRGETRRRSQPRDEHGPHGRSHRPGNHLRSDAQLRA